MQIVRWTTEAVDGLFLTNVLGHKRLFSALTPTLLSTFEDICKTYLSCLMKEDKG